MAASDFLPDRNGPSTIAPLTKWRGGEWCWEAIELKHWDEHVIEEMFEGFIEVEVQKDIYNII